MTKSFNLIHLNRLIHQFDETRSFSLNCNYCKTYTSSKAILHDNCNKNDEKDLSESNVKFFIGLVMREQLVMNQTMKKGLLGVNSKYCNSIRIKNNISMQKYNDKTEEIAIVFLNRLHKNGLVCDHSFNHATPNKGNNNAHYNNDDFNNVIFNPVKDSHTNAISLTKTLQMDTSPKNRKQNVSNRNMVNFNNISFINLVYSSFSSNKIIPIPLAQKHYEDIDNDKEKSINRESKKKINKTQHDLYHLSQLHHFKTQIIRVVYSTISKRKELYTRNIQRQ